MKEIFRGGAESNDCRSILCNTLVKSEEYGNYGYPIEFEVQLDRLVGGTVNFKYSSLDKPARFIVVFDGNFVIDTGYVGAPIYGHKVPPQTAQRDLFTTALTTILDPITGIAYPNNGTTDAALDGYPNINQTTQKSFIKNSSTSTLLVRVYAPLDQTIWSFDVSCPIPPTPTPTRTKVIPTITPSPSRPNQDECVECNNVERPFAGEQSYPGITRCFTGITSGEVVFYFETYWNPDRFIIEYEGQIIADSGFVGKDLNDPTGVTCKPPIRSLPAIGYGKFGDRYSTFTNGLYGRVEPITNKRYGIDLNVRDDDGNKFPKVHETTYTPEPINGVAMPPVNIVQGCITTNYNTSNDSNKDISGTIKFFINGTSDQIYITSYSPGSGTKYAATIKCPESYKCDIVVYPDNRRNCYYSTYSISGDTNPGLVRFNSTSKNTPVRFILRDVNKQLVIDTGYIGDLKYNIGGSNRTDFINSLTTKKDPYLNQTYPITYDPQNPRHIKIASDGYPIVYATNQFEEYFYKKDSGEITAYVDVFDPLCQHDWDFIVLCPCELDCFDDPTPPEPSASSTPLNSVTPTPTITKTITSTPTITPTPGLSPTPSRTQPTQNDCDVCSDTKYGGGQAYPKSFCFDIGTDTNKVVPLNFNAINYPDRDIVRFDNNFVIDTGYVGATEYGYGESLRGDFISTLLGKIDPISGLIYPNVNILNTESDGYPIVFGSRVTSRNFVKNTSTNIVYVDVYAPMTTTQWSFSLGCGVNSPDELVQNSVASPTLTPMPSITPTLTQTNNPYANICRAFSAGRDLTGNNRCLVACETSSQIFGKYLTFNGSIGSIYYANQTACETNNQMTWGFERTFVVGGICYTINDSGAIVSSTLCQVATPTPTPSITQTTSSQVLINASIILGVTFTGVYRIYVNQNLSGTTQTTKLINLPDNNYTDIAMSDTKLWLNSILNNSIDEYNITLSPWSYSYSRTINVSNYLASGNGLAYKSSNVLISGNQGIYEIDITTNNGLETLLFMLPNNGGNIVSEVNGDILYNPTNGNYIVIYNTIDRGSGNIEHYIGEFSSNGSLLNRVTLNRGDFYSIFAQSQKIYVSTVTNEIFELTSNFELVYFGLMDDISLRGAANLESAIIPIPQPSVTPTKTPFPTRTATRTITPTKSVTRTISKTPTPTKSLTPTISITPTITPSISITPTITPTISNTRPFVPSFCSNCQPSGQWRQYNLDCCYIVETLQVNTPTSNIYTTSPSKSNNYSIYGARFYNDGFTKDGRGEISYFSNTLDIWSNTYLQDDFGPMNRSGVWANNIQNKWVGFAIPLVGTISGKRYWIGIGAEKNFKIILNGVELINTTTPPATYPLTGDSYKYWHVYPVDVFAGTSILEVYGLNDTYGSFGCEVYDKEVYDLINATSVDNLNIVFSTITKSNFELVQNLSNIYLPNGFSCATNFSYSSINNNCQKIITCCDVPLVSLTPSISITPTRSATISLTPSRQTPTYYQSTLTVLIDSGICDSWDMTPFADKDSACSKYNECFSGTTSSSTIPLYMTNKRTPQTPIVGDTLYNSNGTKTQTGWYLTKDAITNNTKVIFVNSIGMLSSAEFCFETKTAKGQTNNSCSSLIYDTITIYKTYNYVTNVSKLYRNQTNAQMGISDWNGWYNFVIVDNKVLTIDFDGIIINSELC